MAKLAKIEKRFSELKNEVINIAPAKEQKEGVYFALDTTKRKPVVRVDVMKPTPRARKMKVHLSNHKSIKKAVLMDRPDVVADYVAMPAALFVIPAGKFLIEKTAANDDKGEETPKKKESAKKGKKKGSDKKKKKANDHKKVLIETLKTKHGKIHLVDYSERSLAIFGKKTKKFSKALKGNSGFGFNGALTDVDGEKKPGWIVSKRHEEKLRKILTK